MAVDYEVSEWGRFPRVYLHTPPSTQVYTTGQMFRIWETRFHHLLPRTTCVPRELQSRGLVLSIIER